MSKKIPPFLKIRKRFTEKDLVDNYEYGGREDYFSPIFGNIYYAQCRYYKVNINYPTDYSNPRSSIANLLSTGGCDFWLIEECIVTYNRSFYKLLDIGEAKAALTMIRMQLDNLTAVYAETLYPFRVFHGIFDLGRDLGKVLKGIDTNLKPTDLRNRLDAKYGRISDLYNEYSGFVHPSKELCKKRIPYYYNYKKNYEKHPKKSIKPFIRDMVFVNQVISQVLLEYLRSINDGKLMTVYFKD